MPVVFGTASGNKVPPTIVIGPTPGAAKAPAYGYLGAAAGGTKTFLSPGSAPPSPPPPPPPAPAAMKISPVPATGVSSYQNYSPGVTYVLGAGCDMSGGDGHYTVTWAASSGESGSGTNGQCSFHPTGPGTYTGAVGFNAHDNSGNSANGSTPVNLYLT